MVTKITGNQPTNLSNIEEATLPNKTTQETTIYKEHSVGQNEALIKAFKEEKLKIKTVIMELGKDAPLSHQDKQIIKDYIRKYSDFSADQIIAHFKS